VESSQDGSSSAADLQDWRRTTQDKKLEALARALGPVTEVTRTVDVDGRAVTFAGLRAGAAWGLRAVHRGYGLTLCGSGDPGDSLSLVTIRDVEPYIEGSPS
jgi:hypothetical protein